MKQELVKIQEGNSFVHDDTNLIISVSYTTGRHASAAIGYPGLPNINKDEMKLGDPVVFELPTVGIVEVRLTGLSVSWAEFLISTILPRIGISVGNTIEDPENTPLSTDEVERVKESIDRVKEQLRENKNISEEHMRLLDEKLDYAAKAASRMGRKDWLMLFGSALSNVLTAAIFSAETREFILETVNNAFIWFQFIGFKMIVS